VVLAVILVLTLVLVLNRDRWRPPVWKRWTLVRSATSPVAWPLLFVVLTGYVPGATAGAGRDFYTAAAPMLFGLVLALLAGYRGAQVPPEIGRTRRIFGWSMAVWGASAAVIAAVLAVCLGPGQRAAAPITGAFEGLAFELCLVIGALALLPRDVASIPAAPWKAQRIVQSIAILAAAVTAASLIAGDPLTLLDRERQVLVFVLLAACTPTLFVRLAVGLPDDRGEHLQWTGAVSCGLLAVMASLYGVVHPGAIELWTCSIGAGWMTAAVLVSLTRGLSLEANDLSMRLEAED
jgi:hypothetical protein